MEMFTAIGILLIISFIVYYIKYSHHQKLPPGPVGLPIIGYLHKLGGNSLHLIMHELAATYGDIFSLKLGSRLTVVLSSRELIHELYVKKAKLFGSRPNFVTFMKTNHGAIGLSLCGYNKTYEYNKNNTMRAINRLCGDKSNLENSLQVEVRKMTVLFDKYVADNTVFQPMEVFKQIVPSMFLCIMFDSRFSYDDPEFIDIVGSYNRWFEKAEADNPVDFFSWLQYLPNKRLAEIEACGLAFQNFALKMIDECGCRESNGGLIYSFFKFFGDVSELLHQDKLNLSRIIADLCGGGFDTAASTMAWAFLYLCEKPHVLKRCRAEISSAFGNNPVLNDQKESTSYFCATLYDILRHSSVGPLGLPRRSTGEVNYKSFTIPEGTMIMANIWACNHKSDEWKETEFLHPENFLDDSGQLDSGAVKKLLTFSAGVRRCPGEMLAFSMLYVLLGAIIQKYDFVMKQEPEDMEPKRGVTLKPKYYRMQLINS